jgi:hypothetical protein
MKIRSDIHAGTTFAECDVQRDCWKKQAELMEKYANGSSSTPPSGLQFPPYICTSSSYQPYPSGGGYVNGVYYPDKSGACGSSSSGSTTGGGYVNGVYYPDKSGYC